DPGVGEGLVDQRGVLGVAITDEESDLKQVSAVLQVHDQVADGLPYPSVGGVRGGAENPYAPAGVVDGGEDVLELPGQSDGLDEVHREDRLGLRAQECSPGDGRAVWGR